MEGSYHIDHIVPLSYFDYKNSHSLDFILAWRLENLRITDSEENLIKSDRIDLDIQKSLTEEVSFYRKYPDMYRMV